MGHEPSNPRIVLASRTVRWTTRLSPPELLSETSFSDPPWDPRGRLADTLALSVLTVLVAFSRCRCFSGFAYGLWLPVLAPQAPPIAPPMNGKSKARTPETLRMVPNPC